LGAWHGFTAIAAAFLPPTNLSGAGSPSGFWKLFMLVAIAAVPPHQGHRPTRLWFSGPGRQVSAQLWPPIIVGGLLTILFP